MRWIKTNVYVYDTIWTTHYKEFQFFGTITYVEGSPVGGNPHIMTEWGFKDSEFPLIKYEKTKDTRQQELWDIEYFIAAPTNKDCEMI